MKKSLLIAAAAVSSTMLFAAPAKKFIECSWSNPRTDFLRKNIAHMEKTTPYQGIRIHLEGTGEGKGVGVRQIFGKRAWKYEWFKQDVENLKNTKFVQFTDNFIATGVMPGDVEWFSDSDWASVVNNFKIVARIAKETGMKGIIFDPEEYSAHLWGRIATRNKNISEIAAKARQRGQEWGNAIFSEYPDITIFCFFLSAYAKSSPVFTGFMNGVLDVLPPNAKLVDGHESRGYTASSIADLHRGANEVKKGAELFAPENRIKYLSQIGFAPAIYLESIIPQTEGNLWNRIVRLGSEKYSMSEFLRRHLENCLEVSDEYVWTWSEYRSWHGGKIDGWTAKTWENWLPGMTEIFKGVRNPVEYAEKCVAKTKSQNLFRNPTFTPDAKKFPAKWGLWQGRNSKGTVEVKTIDGKNAAVFHNAGNSNLAQLVQLQPDKRYLLVLKGKVTRTETSPAVSINAGFTWRFEAGKSDWFIGKSVGIAIPPTGKLETVKKVVTVPKEAPLLHFNLTCANQNDAADNCYVESCELYLIPDLVDSPKRLMPKKPVVKKAAPKPAAVKNNPMPAILTAPANLSRTGENLLLNPDFTAKRPGPSYRPWGFGGKSFTYLPNAAGVIKGVLTSGYVVQSIKAVPGNCYELTAMVKSDQPVSMSVKWLNDKMRWTVPHLHYTINMTPEADNVYKGVIRVKAPETIGGIGILISGKGKVDLDKAEIYLLK